MPSVFVLSSTLAVTSLSCSFLSTANGRRDLKQFDNHLEFKIKVIPYVGNDDWVEPTIIDLHQLLTSNDIPDASSDCEYCSYVKDSHELLGTLQ